MTRRAATEEIAEYSALLKNKEGAQAGFVGARDEITQWLAEWDDVRNVYVSIQDEYNRDVGEKNFGALRITWF